MSIKNATPLAITGGLRELVEAVPPNYPPASVTRRDEPRERLAAEWETPLKDRILVIPLHRDVRIGTRPPAARPAGRLGQ